MVLIDSGACVTLVSDKIYVGDVSQTGQGLTTLTGTPIEVVGRGDINLSGLSMHVIVVADLPVAVLMGTDMLRRHSGVINYTENELVIGGRAYPFQGLISGNPGVAEVLDDDQVDQLVARNSAVFYDDHKGLRQAIGLPSMVITTNGDPVYQRPYRTALMKRDVIEDAVEEMLKDGVIESSHSPWASPVTLAPKGGGGGVGGSVSIIGHSTRKQRRIASLSRGSRRSSTR